MKLKFPYLSRDKLDEILSHGYILELSPGETFIEAGERNFQVGFVLSGLMRNYVVSEPGQEITTFFATDMQPVAGFPGIFLNKPSAETSKALEPTVLFVIDFEVFKNKLDTDPFYTRVYSDLIQESLIHAISRIEDFAKKSPEQRYLHLFQENADLRDRVPLKYLASYIGITPVSLSRIRKRMATSQG